MTDHHKGGASAPPAKQFVTPEWIDATLRSHFERGHNSGIDLPPPFIWTILSARINSFIANPWTNHSAGLLARNARKAQEERKVLTAAARILRRDRDRFPDTEAFAEVRRRWGDAIAILQSPRGASDNPRDQLSRPIHPQQTMRGWTYAAREILPDLVVFAVRSRANVKATPGNGIIKTLIDILRFIYPDDNLPSASTICAAVSNDIEKHIKLAKTPPYDPKDWESLLRSEP